MLVQPLGKLAFGSTTEHPRGVEKVKGRSTSLCLCKCTDPLDCCLPSGPANRGSPPPSADLLGRVVNRAESTDQWNAEWVQRKLPSHPKPGKQKVRPVRQGCS